MLLVTSESTQLEIVERNANQSYCKKCTDCTRKYRMVQLEKFLLDYTLKLFLFLKAAQKFISKSKTFYCLGINKFKTNQVLKFLLEKLESNRKSDTETVEELENENLITCPCDGYKRDSENL